MSTVFGSFITTARRLIDEKGQLVVWNQRSEVASTQGFFPNTSSVTTYSIRMVFFNKQYMFEDIYFAPRSTLIGYMSPLPTLVPSINDFVTRSGRDLVVSNIKEENPNGEIIYYVVEFS